MGKKKGIDCPEVLGGCGAVCVEVGYAVGYPKYIINDINPNRGGNEYRYTCPSCGREWVHDTLSRVIFEIDETAQFHIKLLDGKEIYETENSYILEHWGLEPGRKYKFTLKEIKELIKRSKAITNNHPRARQPEAEKDKPRSLPVGKP